MRVRMGRDECEEGFTLLEVMIAMALLSVGLLAVATAQIHAMNGTMRSKQLTRSMHLAHDQMEAFHTMPQASLPASGNDANNPIDPDPNDSDVTVFNRSWVMEANTPSIGVTRMTVNVSWTDKLGINRVTAVQSLKAP